MAGNLKPSEKPEGQITIERKVQPQSLFESGIADEPMPPVQFFVDSLQASPKPRDDRALARVIDHSERNVQLALDQREHDVLGWHAEREAPLSDNIGQVRFVVIVGSPVEQLTRMQPDHVR